MGLEQSTQQQVLPSRKCRVLNPFAVILISTNLALLVMAVWAIASFGSIRGAVGYYLRGETLFFDSTEKSFGVASPGEKVTVAFRLTNRGRKPIRVLGCSAICTCTLPTDLPFTLGPNESRDVTLSIREPKRQVPQPSKPKDLSLEVTLFTNNAAQSRIPLTVKGRILENGAF